MGKKLSREKKKIIKSRVCQSKKLQEKCWEIFIELHFKIDRIDSCGESAYVMPRNQSNDTFHTLIPIQNKAKTK
jgi:hypothetical protein